MKKEGPEKIVDGTTYWWCLHHRLEGVFDGLYMTHRPGHEHDLWKEAKDKIELSIMQRNRRIKVPILLTVPPLVRLLGTMPRKL